MADESPQVLAGEIDRPGSPLDRVRRVMPELDVASIRAGEDGLVNDVMIVNEELVFRFGRTAEAEASLEREAATLAVVGPRVTVRVPELVHQTVNCLVLRFIPGVPLTRHLLLAQPARTRAALLEQVGEFLHQLHAIPPSPSPDPGRLRPGAAAREEAERLYRDLERELLPATMVWARVWVRDLFRPVLEGRLDLTYVPAWIHGDFAPYHLCYDPAARRLVGVIDFGEAGPGDPAADLGSVINGYGESLLRGMGSAYPDIAGLIDRARFMAATLELRWALAALRTRDPAWFLCHLGYARDAWPVGWPWDRRSRWSGPSGTGGSLK